MSDTTVKKTTAGTAYLTESYARIMSRPQFLTEGLQQFLESFDKELEFEDYLNDPTELKDADQLDKTAGQLCYLSFGPKRSTNAVADKYFDNIKESGHGSVLEHSNFTILFWGLDRSATHELVRHRAGFGFSQVSQRYVSGKMLRFVERPEFQSDSWLHERFLNRIDEAKKEYDRLADYMAEKVRRNPHMQSLSKTDLRKMVNQSARACLPNETEAPIVVTANGRGWRHFLEQRASMHADNPIRLLANKAHEVLSQFSDHIFSDYTSKITDDGRGYLDTSHRKV